MKHLGPIDGLDPSEPSRYELVSVSFRGMLFRDLKWDKPILVKFSFRLQILRLLRVVKITPIRLLDMKEGVATYLVDRKWSANELRLYMRSEFENSMIDDCLSGDKYLHAAIYQWSKEHSDDLAWYMNPWVVATVSFWVKPAFEWPTNLISVYNPDGWGFCDPNKYNDKNYIPPQYGSCNLKKPQESR